MDNTQNQNEQASDGNEQTHTVVIYGELGDGPQTQVVILDETMWLTQRQMSTLFNVSVPTINAHLKNVFESRELDGECQDFCVWGGYSRGSPTRLPFVFEMQYARPDAIAGAKVEGPARSAGGSSLAPAIARREAAGALAREV